MSDAERVMEDKLMHLAQLSPFGEVLGMRARDARAMARELLANRAAKALGWTDTDELTRLRTALAASEKDKAALALAAAAMREPAAKAVEALIELGPNYTAHYEVAARAIRALPLPDPTTISAQVDALVRAGFALLDDKSMTYAVRASIFKAALQPLRDAGFGGEGGA